MGLDIYIYDRAAHEAGEALDKKYPEEWLEQATEEQREAYWKEYSALPGAITVESQRHPGNINERRYLRSSYNAGGFDSVAPEVTGDETFTYRGIFAPLFATDGHEYLVKVDDPSKVREARDNAKRCLDALEALRDEPVIRVTTERAVPLRPQDIEGGRDDSDYALATAKEHIARHESGNALMDSYGTANGTFWLGEPLKIRAAIPGTDFMGTPCMHLVYETTLHESYIDSADVLLEFCDELLDLIAADGCAYLHWSG